MPRLPSDLLSERGRGLFLIWSMSEDFNVTKRADGGAHARVVLSPRRKRRGDGAVRVRRGGFGRPRVVTVRERFERDGFVVLPGFKSPADVAALRARAAEIVAAFDPAESTAIFTTRDESTKSDEYFLTSGDKVRCFFEEEAFDDAGALRQPKELSINKIGHAMHDLDPVFERFSRDPRLHDLALELGLAEPRVYQSMYIFKQPRIGGEVRWHQDATYFDTDPISVTTLWFALERADRTNGCLWVQRGGHRTPLRERFVVDGGGARLERIDATPWPSRRRRRAGRGRRRDARRHARPAPALQRAEPFGGVASRVHAARRRRARALLAGQLAAARCGVPRARFRLEQRRGARHERDHVHASRNDGVEIVVERRLPVAAPKAAVVDRARDGGARGALRAASPTSSPRTATPCTRPTTAATAAPPAATTAWAGPAPTAGTGCCAISTG